MLDFLFSSNFMDFHDGFDVFTLRVSVVTIITLNDLKVFISGDWLTWKVPWSDGWIQRVLRAMWKYWWLFLNFL